MQLCSVVLCSLHAHRNNPSLVYEFDLCCNLYVYLCVFFLLSGSLFSVLGFVGIATEAMASLVYNGVFPVLGQNTFYLLSGIYAVPIPALM